MSVIFFPLSGWSACSPHETGWAWVSFKQQSKRKAVWLIRLQAVSAFFAGIFTLDIFSCPEATMLWENPTNLPLRNEMDRPWDNTEQEGKREGEEQNQEKNKIMTDQSLVTSNPHCSSFYHHLIGSPWETLSPKHPSKCLPNSWPTETVRNTKMTGVVSKIAKFGHLGCSVS